MVSANLRKCLYSYTRSGLVQSKLELVMNHEPVKPQLALEGHGRRTHSD